MYNGKVLTALTVACFGEILWDHLPTGALPGGAPGNVAYHLTRLGDSASLITRIGKDEDGASLRNLFASYGLETGHFQLDDQYPTGKVIGQPNEHQEMTYDIIAPSAWDFITCDQSLKELVARTDFFVFGSLASRHPESRETLFQLLASANCRVLDINLRAPFYDKDIVTRLLQNADFLKLNAAELDTIAGWFSPCEALPEKIDLLQQMFDIDIMLLTMGGDGAWLKSGRELIKHPGYRVKVADTVGAGDAFLAAFLHGLAQPQPLSRTLDQAASLGSFVASRTGACPDYIVDNGILSPK